MPFRRPRSEGRTGGKLDANRADSHFLRIGSRRVRLVGHAQHDGVQRGPSTAVRAMHARAWGTELSRSQWPRADRHWSWFRDQPAGARVPVSPAGMPPVRPKGRPSSADVGERATGGTAVRRVHAFARAAELSRPDSERTERRHPRPRASGDGVRAGARGRPQVSRVQTGRQEVRSDAAERCPRPRARLGGLPNVSGIPICRQLTRGEL